MARNRDEQLQIIEALISPRSIFDIMLVLNTPGDCSPYKKELDNKIIEGVSFEDFLEVVEVLLEISREVSLKMREELVRERLDQISYEQLQTKLAFQFNLSVTKEPKKVSSLSLENRIENLTAILAIELRKKPTYESKREALKAEIKTIEKSWANREKESANAFYATYEAKMKSGALGRQIELTPAHEERMKKAFETAPPEKLIKLNQDVIKEAYDADRKIEFNAKKEVGEEQKNLDQVCQSMAAKNDFIRNLQVLTEAGRIEHENSDKKDKEYFPKPTRIKQLNQALRFKSTVNEDKNDIAQTIKLDRELKETERKLVRIDVIEEKLETAKKEQAMQKSNSPDSPG